MIKKVLIALFMLTMTIRSECLNTQILASMGFKPLETPTTAGEGAVCGNFIKDTVKTCVDLDEAKVVFEKYVSQKNEKKKGKYQSATKTLDNLGKRKSKIEEKVKKDKEKLDKKKDQSGPKKRLELNEKMVKELENLDKLREDLESSKSECEKDLNKVALGTLCYLISDQASSYVVETDVVASKEQDKDKVKEKKDVTNFYDGSLNLPSNLTFKVKSDTSQKTVKACGKLLETNCAIKRFKNMLKNMKKGENDANEKEVSDKRCPTKLKECAGDDSSTDACKTENKQTFEENFNVFKPLMDEDDIKEVDKESEALDTNGLLGNTSNDVSFTVDDNGADVATFESGVETDDNIFIYAVSIFSALLFLF